MLIICQNKYINIAATMCEVVCCKAFGVFMMEMCSLILTEMQTHSFDFMQTELNFRLFL